MNRLTINSWRPSLFIRASFYLHLVAIMIVVLMPALWSWILGIIIANHALLSLAGMLPRCSLLGPNLTRIADFAAAKGKVAITIDDGPDPEVTPAILELFDQYHAKASFFCIGEKVMRYPELAREIINRGHAIENHTFGHGYHFALLGPSRLFKELQSAQDATISITGVCPKFFRAPAGFRNPFLDPVLSRLDLQLASWTRRGFDTSDGNVDAVTTRLLRNLKSGDILLLHDGNSARTTAGTAVVLEVLPKVLSALAAAGLESVTLRSIIK